MLEVHFFLISLTVDDSYVQLIWSKQLALIPLSHLKRLWLAVNEWGYDCAERFTIEHNWMKQNGSEWSPLVTANLIRLDLMPCFLPKFPLHAKTMDF